MSKAQELKTKEERKDDIRDKELTDELSLFTWSEHQVHQGRAKGGICVLALFLKPFLNPPSGCACVLLLLRLSPLLSKLFYVPWYPAGASFTHFVSRASVTCQKLFLLRTPTPHPQPFVQNFSLGEFSGRIC